MFSLPPPPRFTLPPPPPIIDSKILFQLTCSSIRQQRINPYLISISCIILLIITIFFTLLFIWIYRRKTLSNTLDSKPASIYRSRSYETISSGIYLESINISSANSNSSQIPSSHLYYDIYSTVID